MYDVKNHGVVFSVLLFLFPAGPARCPASFPADDVSGSWDLAVETRQATARPSVTFIQSGERLSGTYHGRMGETTLQGTIEENKIQFTVKLKFRDEDILVRYSGIVEGDTMRGTVQFGDSASGNWTARRKTGG